MRDRHWGQLAQIAGSARRTNGFPRRCSRVQIAHSGSAGGCRGTIYYKPAQLAKPLPARPPLTTSTRAESADLDEAITVGREAVRTMPPDCPDRSMILHDLSIALGAR